MIYFQEYLTEDVRSTLRFTRAAGDLRTAQLPEPSCPARNVNNRAD